MTDRVKQFEQEGAEACSRGVSPLICPYPVFSKEGRDWQMGYAMKLFKLMQEAQK